MKYKEKEYNEIGYRISRFFCECEWANHILEISEDIEGPISSIQVAIYADSTESFWQRLKFAFNYLFLKKDLPFTEIYINPNDREELAKAILPKE